MRIDSASRLEGTVLVPGDKSISHRYAILAAMAQGRSRIENFSASQDCHSTLGCLSALGVQVEERGSEVTLTSGGWAHLREPSQPLDAGNSGTTIRLLSGLLASRPIRTVIGGDESLNRRPMRRIMDPLTLMGARIVATAGQFPPLTISGGQLQPISYELPVASAQVKSCILLAGLTAVGTTTVIEREPSRDHTERALPCFGGRVEQIGNRIQVSGPSTLTAADVRVPGDFSAAVFFILAAAMIPGSEIDLPGVGVNTSRTALLGLLGGSGAEIASANFREENGEPVADLRVRFRPAVLTDFPARIDGKLIPNLIDEIPALAVFGTRLQKGLEIRNASELRKKESDRIRSIVDNLLSLGVRVEEFEDGFFVPGNQTVAGGQVRTFGDHRIAMAFALAGLIAQGPVELDDPGCAAVSFPAFYTQLELVTR